MDIPTHAELLSQIDAFLLRHNMAPTRLGRDATGEASLVATIRAGRSPSLDTLNRLAAFMVEHDAKLDSADWPIGAGGKCENLTAPETIDPLESGAEVPHAPFSPTSSGTNERSPSKRNGASQACSDGLPSTDDEAQAA